jgi:Secretion system C-terminal sorting domain
MKKIYLSLCSILFAFGAFAQDITFVVDMTPYISAGGTLPVNASNVKIAGTFGSIGLSLNDWDPLTSPTFTNVNGNFYSTTISFPSSAVGSALEFKFILSTAGWGANCNDLSGANTYECMAIGDVCTNGSNDNRYYTIPSLNETICFLWDTCTVCSTLGIEKNSGNLSRFNVSPNPSVNNAVITYVLKNTENVQVRVYNTLGAEVAVLTNETQSIGSHNIFWNTSAIDKGLYTVVVKTASGTKSARIAVQ